MSEETDQDDDTAHFLIERGDMGFAPRGKFPTVIGNSQRAQIWRAAVGANPETHQRHVKELANEAEARRKHKAWLPAQQWGYTKVRPGAIIDVSLTGNGDVRHLTKEQFANLFGAVAFANWKYGQILDVHVTISWKLLGYEEHSEAAHALDKGFIKHYSAWCRANNLNCVWVYTNECGEQMGFHTHFLTSVPKHLFSSSSRRQISAFRKWVMNRLIKLSRVKPMPKEAFQIEGGPSGGGGKSGPTYRQWRRLFPYLCKGIDPYTVIKPSDNNEELVLLSDLLERKYESPGQLNSKNREGVSFNIGEASRKAEKEFVSSLDEMLSESGKVDVRQLYSGEEYQEWKNRQGVTRLKD